jgi:hydroxyacylglutathione hydrolase
MIELNFFINDINKSNCYVLQDQKNKSCIIIDPGSLDTSQITGFLKKNKLVADYIFLTHSHFDHIAGVSRILKVIPAKIVSSGLCSDKIVDPVKNLSYFADFGLISSPKADIIVEDLNGGRIKWNDKFIYCFLSPGHSRCSICIQIENRLFTGDTIIKGLKTKITHPDGNREELKETLNFIYKTIPGGTQIFPGHGESFILETQDLSVSMYK